MFKPFHSVTPKGPGSFAAAVALVACVLLTCGATGVSAQEVPNAQDVPSAQEVPLPQEATVPQDVAPPVPVPGAAPAPVVVEGTLSEYFVYLPQVTAPAGAVRFVVENIGRQRHNLRVFGTGIDQVTPTLRPGQSGTLDVVFVDPGPYTIYCDLADHADRGMSTTLVVEDTFTKP